MLINVKVITNAAKNQIIQKSPNEFVVRITAAPEKGKANKKVIDFLADYFNLKKSDILIKKGQTSSRKIISIKD